jgi:hypothetical protein
MKEANRYKSTIISEEEEGEGGGGINHNDARYNF